MTMGAFTLPVRDELVEREPRLSPGRRIRASRSAPAIPGTSPARERATIHARRSSSGTAARTASSVTAMSAGSPLERDPAKRPFAGAEERSNVRRNEAGDVERALAPRVGGAGANVVAVVEHLRSRAPSSQSIGYDLFGHARFRALDVPIRVVRTKLGRLLERQAGGDVAVQRIVRGGLLGDQTGHDAPPRELGEHVGRVGAKGDTDGLSQRACGVEPRKRGLEIGGALVDVSGRDSLLDARPDRLPPRGSSCPPSSQRGAAPRPCPRGPRSVPRRDPRCQFSHHMPCAPRRTFHRSLEGCPACRCRSRSRPSSGRTS